VPPDRETGSIAAYPMFNILVTKIRAALDVPNLEEEGSP